MEQSKEKPGMDFDTVKKVIKIVEESDISALSVEKGDFKVEVRRETGFHHIPVVPQHAVSQHQAAEKPSGKTSSEEEDLTAITSPMVGTFYRSSSPDSPPYVEEGDDIEKGKIVCIVEAMKLFNEIESDISGKIVKILVENASPVEFGQRLMLVKKR